MANNRAAVIAQMARARGLDPAAVLSIASVEGGFNGSIGDHGTSFGPFQLHEGGALPSGLSGQQAQSFANSAQGLAYALDRIKQVAGGLQGKAAIAAISSKFERPANVPGEISNATAHYGQFSGGKLPAGGGALPQMPAAGIGGVPGLGQLDPTSIRSAFAQQLLANVQGTITGAAPDTAGLLGLAQARQQLGQIQQPTQMQPGAPAAPQAGQATGHLKFLGASLSGENQGFLTKLAQAVQAAGGTKVNVTSGVRSAGHNAAVGGVQDSNHITGHAVDGNAYVPGQGWVPLGTLLQQTASKFGLRSGDQPGFYRGGPDYVHVDDGFNVRR